MDGNCGPRGIRRWMWTGAAVVASGIALSCSDGTAPVRVAFVSITPEVSTIGVGGSVAVSAELLDANGHVLTGRTVNWSSSDNNVAIVSNSGVVTGVSPGGPVFITASSGGVDGTASVTVLLTADPCEVVTPIVVGQSINGTLVTADCQLEDLSYFDLYSLTLSSAASVRVNLSSAAFDTWLMVLTSNFDVVGVNDDIEPEVDLNSRLDLNLTAGSYIIVANAVFPNTTGAYTVAVTPLTGAVAAISGDQPRMVRLDRVNFSSERRSALSASKRTTMAPLKCLGRVCRE